MNLKDSYRGDSRKMNEDEEEVMIQAKEILDKNADALDILSELHSLLVPAMGRCKDKFSEAVRLINRIIYRYYNDGDTVKNSRDIRKEYSALSKIIRYLPSLSELAGLSDSEYEENLSLIAKWVLDDLNDRFDKLFSSIVS